MFLINYLQGVLQGREGRSRVKSPSGCVAWRNTETGPMKQLPPWEDLPGNGMPDDKVRAGVPGNVEGLVLLVPVNAPCR